MTLTPRGLPIACIYALVLGYSLPSCGAAQDEPALAVTVIAVTSFRHISDSDSNDKISQEIDASAEHVRKFFETNYKVPVRVLKSPEKTTSGAIRYLLFNDLPFDSHRVHLIFVLSHGMERAYHDSPGNSELFIATSDTDNQKPEGNAIRGDELLSGIGHLPNGTSAFLFLDTCNSASIGSFVARLVNLINSQATLSRTMVLASSLEDQYSYHARFTEALIKVWSSPGDHCSATPQQMALTLADAMKQVDPASHATAQDVSLALRYNTERDFCVESFMAGHALLILSNPTYNPLWVSFSPDSGTLGVIEVLPRAVVPILLSRSSYKMVVSKNSAPEVLLDRVSEASLDFTNDFVKIQPLTDTHATEPQDSEVLAATYQKSADVLESWELGSAGTVAALREKAKNAYSEARDQNEKEAAALSVSLAQYKQTAAAVELQVTSDSDAAKRALQDLETKRGNAVGGSFGANLAGAVGVDGAMQESGKDANLAQAKLESSFEKLNEVESVVSSQEANLRKAQLKSINEQEKLNDVSLSLVKAQILQDREKSVALVVKQDLGFVGVFHQTSRGATIVARDSDTLAGPVIRKLADLLIANPAITLELEYVVAGKAKSSAEYQAIAEKRLALIRNQLVRLSVRGVQLIVRGYGLGRQENASREFNLVFTPCS